MWGVGVQGEKGVCYSEIVLLSVKEGGSIRNFVQDDFSGLPRPLPYGNLVSTACHFHTVILPVAAQSYTFHTKRMSFYAAAA